MPAGTFETPRRMSVSSHHDPNTEITTITVASGYERPEYKMALESAFLATDARRILADHTAEGPVWGSEDLEGHLQFLLRIRRVDPGRRPRRHRVRAGPRLRHRPHDADGHRIGAPLLTAVFLSRQEGLALAHPVGA